MTIALALVCAASLAAAVSDLRTRRIPNLLAVALFFCGLILNAFAGWHALAADLAITLAVLFLGSIAFSFKLIGGGDIKMLAAAAGALAYPSGPHFILYTLLCGGAVALIYSALRGRLAQTLANMRGIALPLLAGVRPAQPQNGTAMPYALAILAGALCTAIVSGIAPHVRILP
jgi:prepilin peptidase CpaA